MSKTPRMVTSDKNPVGMIVSSMLTLAQFQNINGTGWVLADGGSAAGSTYASVTGFTIVPDLRGLALRSKNNGRADGSQNPDGDLALGTLQAHGFASHTHTPTLSVTFGSSLTNAGPVVAGSADNRSATSSPPLGTSISNAVNGGNETRMTNVTVNRFIKINN